MFKSFSLSEKRFVALIFCGGMVYVAFFIALGIYCNCSFFTVGFLGFICCFTYVQLFYFFACVFLRKHKFNLTFWQALLSHLEADQRYNHSLNVFANTHLPWYYHQRSKFIFYLCCLFFALVSVFTTAHFLLCIFFISFIFSIYSAKRFRAIVKSPDLHPKGFKAFVNSFYLPWLTDDTSKKERKEKKD